jgi:hypothetical protein
MQRRWLWGTGRYREVRRRNLQSKGGHAANLEKYLKVSGADPIDSPTARDRLSSPIVFVPAGSARTGLCRAKASAIFIHWQARRRHFSFSALFNSERSFDFQRGHLLWNKRGKRKA